jgi:hypothetical protein
MSNTPGHLSLTASSLGEWLASCGPRRRPPITTYVMGVISLLMGAGCFFVPIVIAGKTPKDTQFATIAFNISGCCMILIGLVLLILPQFYTPTEVHLFSGGIVYRERGKDQVVSWDSIEELKLVEWYNDRFSPQEINVAVMVKGGQKLSFSSSLKGEADRIIKQMSENVENTTFTPFTP